MKKLKSFNLKALLPFLMLGSIAFVVFPTIETTISASSSDSSSFPSTAEDLSTLDSYKHSKDQFQSLLNVMHNYYPEITQSDMVVFICKAFIKVKERLPDASLYDFVCEVKDYLRDHGTEGLDGFKTGLIVVGALKMQGY